VTRLVVKPWGGEEIFAETERYAGKILTVHAGHSLSVQYHRAKDETMRVLEGTCELHFFEREESVEARVVRMEPGAVCRIRPGTIHRLVAVTDTKVIEVSSPELDDVVRIQDHYGRKGTANP
jgi:mannose-6-phosphate isomerase